MRIEYEVISTSFVGGIAESETARLVIETPDVAPPPWPTVTIIPTPLGQEIRPTYDRSRAKVGTATVGVGTGGSGGSVDNPTGGPLWQHARDFIAHEFSYLGPHGADEMADRFMDSWRRGRGQHH